MNILEVKQFDVVNGPGIRMSIWIAGCTNACKGCWSPHTWNRNQGTPINMIINTIIEYSKHPQVRGISILGGDPFCEFMNNGDTTIFDLISLLAKSGKPIWLWTGYRFEDIVNKCRRFPPDIINTLQDLEVIVDGRFEEEHKDLNLLYRGSSNQRVIDVAKTIDLGKIHLK
jgi:anaerobic ribonucleoside-triphosphate reductase activating protein